jgi:prepilin-type N-terminal cleavage/methylation domain-containing protein
MTTKRRLHKTACGMTLTEIMLAMALLASAFIPIIGVMGTSMKVTDKDDRTIRAVNICQDKMNRALQFPFGILEPPARGTVTYGGVASQTLRSDSTGNAIELHLGPEEINGVPMTTELVITDLPGRFQVPTFDDDAKFRNATDTTQWGWTEQNLPYEGLYYRYVLTVRWRDKGSNEDKFYTLASNKARIRR